MGEFANHPVFRIALVLGLLILIGCWMLTLLLPRLLLTNITSSELGVAAAETAALSQQLGLWCAIENLQKPPPGTTLDVLTQGKNPLLRTKDLIDPWGRAYQVAIPGNDASDYTVFTLGRDGVAGGTGEDADIAH